MPPEIKAQAEEEVEKPAEEDDSQINQDQGADAKSEPSSEEGKSNEEKISDKEAALLKENMAKKNQIKELKEKLDKLEGSLSDIDLDVARKAIEQVKKTEKEQLEKRGEFDRLRTMMVEEHNKQLEAIKKEKAEVEAAVAEREKLIKDLTIGNAFGNSKFVAEKMILTPAKVRTLYGDHFDIEGGKVTAYDKPRGASERTPLVDGAGNALGFDQALEKIVKADSDAARVIKTDVKAGAGSKSADSKEPAKQASSLDKISAGLSSLAKGVK